MKRPWRTLRAAGVLGVLALALCAFHLLSADAAALAEGGGAGGTKGGACAEDGSALAPKANPQYPKLLSGYAARSPCQVAGVDYAVGVPAGRRLKDPTVAANLPRGMSYNPVQKLVRCDGARDVVVQDLDFSLHGGVGLYVVSCKNAVVRYNRFQMGPNCAGAIVQAPGSSGIRVEYNLVDGGGGSSSATCPRERSGELVTLGGADGEKTVRYNHLRNAPQHFLTFTSSGAIDMRFNLIERCGFYQGAHCNGFQIVGGRWDKPRIDYNTFISGQPDTALAGVTGTFKRGADQIAGVVLGGHEASLLPGMSVVGDSLQPGTKVAGQTTEAGVTTIRLSRGAAASGVAKFDVADAYPFGLVIPVRYVAQIGGDLSGGSIIGNTIVTTGPIKGVSYAIYCSADDDRGYKNANSDAAVHGNYIDASGATGFFYPSRVCTGQRFGSVKPNIDMVTGRKISSP